MCTRQSRILRNNINLVNDNINFTIAPMLNKLADGNIAQALASFVKIEGKQVKQDAAK